MDTETPNYAILTKDIVGSSRIIVQHTNLSWMDKLYFSFLRILHRTFMNIYRLIPQRLYNILSITVKTNPITNSRKENNHGCTNQENRDCSRKDK